jgi:hypothetical protein
MYPEEEYKFDKCRTLAMETALSTKTSSVAQLLSLNQGPRLQTFPSLDQFEPATLAHGSSYKTPLPWHVVTDIDIPWMS